MSSTGYVRHVCSCLRSAKEMIDLIKQLAPHEGYTRTLLESVRLMRADHPLGRTPVLYEPSIVIVCQEASAVMWRTGSSPMTPSTIWCCRCPCLFDRNLRQQRGAAAGDFSAAQYDLDSGSGIRGRSTASGAMADPMGIVSTPLDGALADTALRLLRALTDSLEARVLGPGIVRELCFRVLTGVQGGAIRAALASHGSFGRIARALKRIHDDYAQALDVGLLSGEVGMSIPTFHAHFKTVTGTSPVQYIKSVRLHRARLLMIRDNLTAAGAAVRVGYESPSQFNREFKRTFGRTPGEEAREMKMLLR